MIEPVTTLQQALARIGEEVASQAFFEEAEIALFRHGKIRYTLDVATAANGVSVTLRYSPARSINLLSFIKLKETNT